MERNSHSGKAAIIVILACLLAGCKSRIATTTSSAEIMKTEEAFFASVLNHAFRFNTFSARFNLDFSGMQQEFSSKAQLKLIRDDRLQISIQPLFGIEMFRIEISNDSIKILDKMNKRYVADNYIHLKSAMDIDFNFQNLQALITNQLFVPGENHVSAQHYRQFRITKGERSAEFQLKDRNDSYFTFLADGFERLLSTTIENRQQEQMLTWDYSQFQVISGRTFPMKMNVRLSSEGLTQGFTTLTFSEPDIDSPITLDFRIPTGFSKVTLEQLIHSFRQK